MQTYSHLLLTTVLRRKLHNRGTSSHPTFLLGSVLPDVPLVILTIGYIVHRRWINPALPDKTKCSPTYNSLYFGNKWWILSHHLFHAPILLLAYALIGDWADKRDHAWGAPLFWLAVGAALHVGLDIFTHHDDGPLLLYPFDWQTRYHAPISYWDAEKGGRTFALIEHALDAMLLYATVQSGDWKRIDLC